MTVPSGCPLHVRGGRGDPVTVTVTYTSVVRVPFINWLLAGRTGVHMDATATDRQEFG